MSSSSSSDLENDITEKIALGRKNPTKKKKTKPSTVVVTGHGRNEGDDPHWAYEPPKDAVLLDHLVEAGTLDWDEVNDDEDTEIWLIRVPDSIKSKHLKGLEIDPPSSSRTARIGGLTQKDASFDVWSIGDDDGDVAGGEELRGLSCLLPRKRKGGKLHIAPNPVSHHIVISAQPLIATAPEDRSPVYQNPPRPSYTKDVLKHSFVPYGARSKRTLSEDLSMSVDTIETMVDEPAEIAPIFKDQPSKSKDHKGKKRKGGGDTPKKSKKHKPNI